MSKRRLEVWSTHKGAKPKIVSRSTHGQFSGPVFNCKPAIVEVWSTPKGPVLKPVPRLANGRFM